MAIPARYRQQVEQAQTYYRHAAQLVPQNGQPYNQLAILEAARGNKLSTVFYYIRSLAVRHPFPVAATNLEKFYIKLTKDIDEERRNMSMGDVLNSFLQFIALVHLASRLDEALHLCDDLLSSLPSHLTSQSFSTSALLEMTAIIVFALSYAQKNLPVGSGEDSNLSQEEEKALALIHNFAVAYLDMLLQAIPKQEQKAKEYFTLVPIKVLLDWIHFNPSILQKPQMIESSLWTGLAKLLNNIQETTLLENYDDVPLLEDCDLRCFEPLEQAHSVYNYSRVPVGGLETEVQSKLRCQRLLDHGKWLVQVVSRPKLLKCTSLETGRLNFSSQSYIMKGAETFAADKKFGRQNVAIQAIIQKKRKPEEFDGKQAKKQEEMSKVSINTVPEQSPAKYLLGTPTSEPQFMKHGVGKSVGQLLHLRQPSPSLAHPVQSTAADKNIDMPRGVPSNQIDHDKPNITSSPAFPHFPDMVYSTDAAVPIPDPSNPRIQTNSPYSERYSVQPQAPSPMQAARSTEAVISFKQAPQPHMQEKQHQVAAIPQQQYPNVPPAQIVHVVKYANQPAILNTSQPTAVKTDMSLGQNLPLSAGQQNMPSPTFQSQHPKHNSNMPLFGGTAGFADPPLRPVIAFAPTQPSVVNDKKQRPPFHGFNPRTIQPPPPTILDARNNSSFQGHAEGTPKPENFGTDDRRGEKSMRKGLSQPRTYSLFSSSPWDVAALPAAEQGVPAAADQQGLRAVADTNRFQNLFENRTASQVPFNSSAANPLQPSLWSSTGPSPLERLLELQKQQRHSDQQ